MEFEIKNKVDLEIMGVELCDLRVNKLDISKRTMENEFNINFRSINFIEKGVWNKSLKTFLNYCKAMGFEVTLKLEKAEDVNNIEFFEIKKNEKGQ